MLMATITLEVPDEVARQLEDVGENLPGLLTYALDLAGLTRQKTSNNLDRQSPWNEVFAFLSGAPTVDEILDYKISDESQDRLEELLDLNREGDLTQQENDELDVFAEIDHMFILLKAYLRQNAAVS